jgi:hypothetical protein
MAKEQKGSKDRTQTQTFLTLPSALGSFSGDRETDRREMEGARKIVTSTQEEERPDR